ncbi:MAG TPA: hypothetical protein VMW36_08750 [Patescibacteria group bacterium]|nr:hypothetical protein [Patescibacteria group bacterium]
MKVRSQHSPSELASLRKVGQELRACLPDFERQYPRIFTFHDPVPRPDCYPPKTAGSEAMIAICEGQQAEAGYICRSSGWDTLHVRFLDKTVQAQMIALNGDSFTSPGHSQLFSYYFGETNPSPEERKRAMQRTASMARLDLKKSLDLV